MTFLPRLLSVLAPVLVLLPLSAVQAAKALPFDCGLMASAIGVPVATMVPADESGWQHGPQEARLICSWHTQAAAKAIAEQKMTPEAYQDAGVLTAQLVVYDTPLQRAEAAMMNAAFDIPAGLAPNEAWLFSFKQPDMAAKLGILPPEILHGSLGVSVAFANSFVSDTGTGSQLTVGWSVETAARILTAALQGR